MKVLIVEDSIRDRQLLRCAIEHQGQEVVEAANGQQGLEAAARHRPDLIISDALMPVMDGFEFLRQMKKDEHLRHIPFVFFSAVYTGAREEELARALGAVAFIEKPLTPKKLWDRIEQALVDLAAEECPPAPVPVADAEVLLESYGRVVAAKLIEKVRELEEAKGRIEKNESRYRAMFSSIRDLVVVADLDRCIIEANQPALKNLFGYELDELKGRKTSVLYADEKGFSAAGAAVFERHDPGAGRTMEISFRRKHGEVFVGEMVGVKLVDEAGEITGNLGVIRDITARKEAEKKIRQGKEDWERTFDAISDIVTVQDAEHRIERANQAACLASGLSKEELVGRRCYEVLWRAPTPCQGCPATDAFVLGRECSAEMSIFDRGKTSLVTCSPITERDGKVRRIVHIIRDITSLKTLESQLRQAQKMEAVGTLAGGIAHDFNNILTPILGYAEILKGSVPPESKQYRPLQEIYRAGIRARDLIKQILTFSRQAEGSTEPLSVHLVVSEALKFLRSSIPTSIDLKQNIDKNCGKILANATQIHQVVMNLCTNAYHAMEEKGGVLEVSLSRRVQAESDREIGLPPGEYVCLTVQDSGHGMDEKTKEKIFEPYFTTKKAGKGTGLGLAMVHGIVANHGGAIGVRSEVGKGTLFTVYFPAVAQDAAGGVGSVLAQSLPEGSERVLVVDDEPQILQLHRSMLESLGYTVLGANGSLEAMQLLQADPSCCDLVLTDMTMPDMNGLDLARKIADLRPDLPVLLCTGFSELVDESRAKQAGIRQFFFKPVLRADLAKGVRRVLDGIAMPAVPSRSITS